MSNLWNISPGDVFKDLSGRECYATMMNDLGLLKEGWSYGVTIIGNNETICWAKPPAVNGWRRLFRRRSSVWQKVDGEVSVAIQNVFYVKPVFDNFTSGELI